MWSRFSLSHLWWGMGPASELVQIWEGHFWCRLPWNRRLPSSPGDPHCLAEVTSSPESWEGENALSFILGNIKSPSAGAKNQNCSHQIVLIALWLSPACMKAYALIHTESQSKLGTLWITSMVMEATSAPLTERERRPGRGIQLEESSWDPLDASRNFLWLDAFKIYMNTPELVHTDYCIQGEGTLPEHLFVARHGRTLLTGLPVQVRQHHVDLKTEEITTAHFSHYSVKKLKQKYTVCCKSIFSSCQKFCAIPYCLHSWQQWQCSGKMLQIQMKFLVLNLSPTLMLH